MSETLGWHVDRWAQRLADAGLEIVAGAERGAALASACRDERAAVMPAALVAVARRLPQGELASLEARLTRSLTRVTP